MVQTKNNGRKFVDFIYMQEKEIEQSDPIAGSFAVVKCKEKYLICYNVWRSEWEIPAGRREVNETPLDCAKRELYEETGQLVEDMTFIGLLKSENLHDGSIKYNPVYLAEVMELQPFQKNNETSMILLWDLQEEIGPIVEVDLHIFRYIEENGMREKR